MKVTSFKDMEVYLYSSVILPLKKLKVGDMEMTSPLTDDNGQRWTLYAGKAEVGRRYRRNYQNDLARSRANYEVRLDDGRNSYRLADFIIKDRSVIMYEGIFKNINAMPLFGKMHEMFTKHTPFTNVIVRDVPPLERPRRDRNSGETQSPYDTLMNAVADRNSSTEYNEDDL